MMANEADAEDVLHDSFIDAFKNLSYYRGESTFGAWLKRIVINKCINAIKKKKLDLVPLEQKEYALVEEPFKKEPQYNLVERNGAIVPIEELEYKHSAMLGVDANLGLEYRLAALPVSFGIDVKPSAQLSGMV